MSQVNFFMAVEDENAFLDFLFSRRDTHVFSGRFFHSRYPAPLLSVEEVGSVSELGLVNKKIKPQAYASGQGKEPLAGKYFFDSFQDPIIEFSRSHLSKERLLNGRIWAKIGWLNPNEANAVYKSWYRSIERWLKKHYRRVDAMWWFGPAAWDWSLAGGVCCFGDELAFAGSLASLPAIQPFDPG